MTRTFFINLLSGFLPLGILFFLTKSDDLQPFVLLWIIVQTACWGSALVLLRWNRDLLGLALAVFIPMALYWWLALLVIETSHNKGQDYTLNLLIEFVLAGTAVLLLRFGAVIVNVRENRLVISVNARPQFQLTWLFSISFFMAIVSVVFLYLQKLGLANPWSLALQFLQVFCWFWIAESLLLPRMRWKSAIVLIAAIGGIWGWYLSQLYFGDVLFFLIWMPVQLMVVVTPLLYRWAGWRIVPRKLAEQLLNYTESKGTANSAKDFLAG